MPSKDQMKPVGVMSGGFLLASPLPMPLDTSVFVITVLSSHWEDYKKDGPLKDCAFLRNHILSKEMFDILNSSSIPNLTEPDISENHFIKSKTKE
jgi:hypothetical protein